MGFRQDVYDLVGRIPKGTVATYGQIAALAGKPRASRQVGFALRALGLEEQLVPWWRVVNREGYLSINHGSGMEKLIQRDLLRAEGIEVNQALRLDLDKYRWEALVTTHASIEHGK